MLERTLKNADGAAALDEGRYLVAEPLVGDARDRDRRHGEAPLTEAQRQAVPPVDHPIVRVHPETGRKCVFLGDHAETIEGMSYAEGRAFVDALNERIVAAARIYTHRWRPGDFIVWDNRCLLHREPRVIRRCTVLGEVPA
jgi:taurine dioxygenase